eukprot:EG_transcript_20472
MALSNKKERAANLLLIAMFCIIIGFAGGNLATTALNSSLSPPARLPSVGSVMVAAGLGPTVTTFVAPPLPADAADHALSLARPIMEVAKVSESIPPAASEIDYLLLGVTALFIPVLGYVAWQFGKKKAEDVALETRRKYQEDLEQGRLLKVSPSGMATVKGFAMASEQGWKIQSDELRARGIRGVSGEELQELLKGDVTLVDVRSAEKYRQAAIPGSINVPLFQPITGWTPFKIARRVQFVFFNVAGTEYNTSFMDTYAAKVGHREADVVFIDDSVRGTLIPTTNFPDGKPGHALMAIYLTTTAGFKGTMRYLEGGIAAF